MHCDGDAIQCMAVHGAVRAKLRSATASGSAQAGCNHCSALNALGMYRHHQRMYYIVCLCLSYTMPLACGIALQGRLIVGMLCLVTI
jgi:hypothetical protein